MSQTARAVSQYDRILEAGKAKGELELRQNGFISRMSDAAPVSDNAQEWLRLDALMFGDYKMFRYIALSSDWQFGRDLAGHIFVSKDHALAILSQELSATKNNLSEMYFLLWFLAVLLAVALFARFSA